MSMTAPRSICPVCGPIVIATRGDCPAGATGRYTNDDRGLISCRACKGTGVFVPSAQVRAGRRNV